MPEEQVQTIDTVKIVSDAERHITRMLNFRKPYDAKRLTYYRQYIASRDGQLFPDNVTKRSNTFVPYPLSNVETIVSRVDDAFFSFEPFMECRPRGQADADAAEKMELVLNYMLRRSSFVRHIEDLVRNIAIYGHAGIKVDWDWDYDIVTYKQPQLAMGPQVDPQTGQVAIDPNTGEPAIGPIMDPNTGGPIVLGYQLQTKQVPRMRPKFIPIDVYDLLVDPDGSYKAFLTERTLGQMKRENETFMAANPNGPEPPYRLEAIQELEAALHGEADSDAVVIRIVELWDAIDNSCTVLAYGKDPEALYWKDTRSAYRAGATRPYRRKAYGGKTVLLWMGQNPFIHKRIPILSTDYIKLPSEVYGLGAIEIISDITEGINRFVNMIADNWNLGINRRYAYDVNADIDAEALNNFNVPGGKVGVSGDPNNVIRELPFFTPQAGDYAILDLYKGMLEMASGISDFYAKGIGAPTGNRTATGINQLIGESNFRFKMFIRNLELEVLQPLLEMCSSMIQQFCTDQIEVQLTDAPAGIPKWTTVQPDEIIGTFSFDLVCANYATGKTVRQRNFMALMNVLAESPYVDQYSALLEIGKVFEIPNIKRMLKTPQQVQAEQQAALQQQIQMMIFEAMLQTESKARLQQSKPQPVHKGQGNGGGRPARMQFEGKIPGAGLTGAIRSMAQNMGAGGMGLEGLGDSAD